MCLLELATNYRNAINSALEDGEFIKTSFSNFPKECCDLTCDLLSQYLIEHNIVTKQVNGIHKDDHLWHHQWLSLYECDVVIDITGDQFNRYKFFNEEIPQVYVGHEGKIHRIFGEERKLINRTNFIGSKFFDPLTGRPNYRQEILIDAYDIISRYI